MTPAAGRTRFEQALPGLGERHRPGRSVKERLTQTGFDALNRLADGTGRHTELVGGLAEGSVLCDREELGKTTEGIAAWHWPAPREGLVII